MEDLSVKIYSEAKTILTLLSASNPNDSSVAYCKVCDINLSST
ncbi:9310_t:CDS:2 [Cetraspora pellucida]|uniref:9310_t:CDS:1 n=1 Tax=Cetraspora pellucida TaxID=1433469 RepID=A0ACA9KQQ7_9GLOM|nr:9310_t:CDS:2 [Cetraspora pellucida]